MLKIITSLFCAAVAMLLCACSTPLPKHTIDVYLEAPERSASFGLHKSIAIDLGKNVLIKAKITQPPVATIDDFTDAEIAEIELPEFDQTISGIRLKTDSKARFKIFQATEDARAKREGIKRLFLFVDGQPVGALQLINPIRKEYLDFAVFMRIGMPDEAKTTELEDIKFRLNEYLLAYREYKQKQQK